MAHLNVVLASLVLCSACADKAPLPDLDTVLTKANSKAHDFAEQAAAMQQRLLDQQEKSRVVLAAQKKEFEQRLDQMQQQNENISVRNSELLAGNTATERDNSALFAELKGIQANNTQMRAALQSLADKVSAAQLFVVDSLKVTDDSRAQELVVLAPTTPKPTLDHFLDVTTGRKVSLLAIGAKPRHDPIELVSSLSNSLVEIKAAEEEGAAELKAQFMASMADHQERQAQLNATQAELLQRKAQLRVYRGKLLEAKAHLQATSEQLQDRLSGMRVFADKVDATVASTLGLDVEGETMQTSNVSATNTSQASTVPTNTVSQPTGARQSNTPQLAAASQSNATQNADASLIAAQKSSAAVNQTDTVSLPVAAVGKAAAAFVKVAQGATRAVSKQLAPSQPALRKAVQAGLKQGATVQANKGDAWRSWFAKLRFGLQQVDTLARVE